MTVENHFKKASDSIVLTGSKEDLKVLLIKRKYDPYKGLWAFPGGFIENGEEADQASKRELLEETGLDLKSSKGVSLSVRKKEGRDPRGKVESFPFLFYEADLEKVKIVGSDDAVEAKWVPLRKIDELAFDHGAILCEALGYFWGDFFEMKGSKDLQNISLPSFLEKGRLLSTDLSERVTFFGGSFNPWHKGHRACLEMCPEKNIIVVPDTNPFKLNEKGFEYKACFWKIFKQTALEMEETLYGFFPGFFGREKVNPTAKWFSKVPFSQKGLLMGDDSFLQLETWTDSRSLLASLTHIYVAPRHFSHEEIKKKALKLGEAFPKIEIVILPNHGFQHESSTALRKKGQF